MYSTARYHIIKTQVLGQINLLRSVLETQSGAEGHYTRGASLNPSGLANTYRTALGDSINSDRYRVEYSEPSIKTSFHFVQDISGSMSGWGQLSHKERNMEKIIPTSPHEDITMSMAALTRGLESLKIKNEWAFCEFKDIDSRPIGASCEVLASLRMVKETVNPPLTESQVEQLVKMVPYTGTDIALYAESAIHLASLSTAERRFACFLTDGYSESARYLTDLEITAKAQGIDLLGIIISRKKEDSSVVRLRRFFQNILVVSSSEEFARGIVGFIAKNVKRV